MPNEIFTKAADLIEELGWWDGTNDNIKGDDTVHPTCAAIALDECGSLHNVTYFAKYLGYKYERGGGDTYYFVTKWNDEQPNKQAVVDKLREAAKAL